MLRKSAWLLPVDSAALTTNIAALSLESTALSVDDRAVVQRHSPINQ